MSGFFSIAKIVAILMDWLDRWAIKNQIERERKAKEDEAIARANAARDSTDSVRPEDFRQ